MATLNVSCSAFGISVGSGSKIFITWVLFLEKELEFLLSFSTLADMKDVRRPAHTIRHVACDCHSSSVVLVWSFEFSSGLVLV